jgi:pyrimidine operon attenuation protein/uracil phosphoribosyltransferase
MPKKVIILNSEQIEQRIIRIAYQILEDSIEEKELVFAGIADRGYIFAERIIKELKKISKQKISLIRISLDKNSTSLKANTDIDVSSAKDKVVILVDDVLNSGRTLAYGLSVFLNVSLKKMRVVVLIDRSHHDYPVYSDFAGLKLSTVLKEHVSVIFSDKPGEDAAYLS